MVCKLIKEWLAVYRSTKTNIHARLQETQFLMEAAYKLLLTYRIDRGFISQEAANEQYNSFYQQLRGIIRKQNTRVYQTKAPKTDINYLALIRTMYHEGHFTLAESAKDFEAKFHDGVLHNGYICFRREGLTKKMQAIEPSIIYI